MTMHALTWGQVHAWRLSQHGLSPRLQRQDFVEAVTRTSGIQAQIFSAAELALWARTDGLAREDIQAALWQHTSKRAQIVVKVQMFSSPTRPTQKGIAAEAERLGKFLNTTVALAYA